MIDEVNGVDWIEFQEHGDERGSLIAIETGEHIDFPIKRLYFIYGTAQGVVRGKHAHRNMNQVLLCVHGKCNILLYDGNKETIVKLEAPKKGVLITGYIWREMFNFSEDCVLLALTDKEYMKTEYIYDKSKV